MNEKVLLTRDKSHAPPPPVLPENPGVKNHANEEEVKKGEKNIKKESPTDHKMELLIDLCITSCVS